MRNKTFLVLLLFFTVYSNILSKDLFPLYGVKVYDKIENLEETFKQWRETGINTVFASETILSQPDFNRLKDKYSIKSFLIAPVFFNPEYLENHPKDYAIQANNQKAISDWVHFVCPSQKEYIKNRAIELKGIIKKTKPDGISIDFIRHFVFWEMVAPETPADSLPNTCFCPRCLKLFTENYQFTFPDDLKKTNDKARWILKEKRNEWREWKTRLVIEAAREVIDSVKSVFPEIHTDFHIVPWSDQDYNGAIKNIAGQDIKKLSPMADFLSPMCYTHMLKRDPLWINELVKNHSLLSEAPIIPSIQVAKSYLKTSFPDDKFEKALINALQKPSQGVIFWSWPALTQHPKKLKIVKKHLNHL